MLRVPEVLAALPEEGEEYELCVANEVFKQRSILLSERIEALISVLTGGLRVGDQESEEKVYALCSQLQETARTQMDNTKGLSSVKEKVKITSLATSTSTLGVEVRVQDLFLDKVDNSRDTLFNPASKLTSKPFATKQSLSESTTLIISPGLASNETLGFELLDNSDTLASAYYRNPYEEEIQFALRTAIPKWMFDYETVACPLRVRVKQQRKRKPVADSLETTPFMFVDTHYQLQTMVEHLTKQSMFAVDLEHHSLRSFQGFTCLMQISSMEQDFIIDVLALRAVIGDALREVFTNPGIVKVLHGSDSDIRWLQQDFGLYVVQMFDTGQAARVLNYPSAGLAFALDRHCQVTANKSLQLADWRLRPLTREMIQYAREDTHFLLGIFDVMRRELLNLPNGLESVLERSAELATKTYEKLVFTSRTYLDLASGDCSSKELNVLAAVVDWRDSKARELDESTEYLLPNRGVKRLAKVCPETVLQLTRELDMLQASLYVKSNAEALLQVIKRGAMVEPAAMVLPALRKKTKLLTMTLGEDVLPKKQDDGFYVGVNALHTFVEVMNPTILPITAISTRMMPNNAASMLFAPNTFIYDMDRVHELENRLAEKAHEDMVTRMANVSHIKDAVDDLLKDLPFSPSPCKVSEEKPAQSVVQTFGQKHVPLAMPKIVTATTTTNEEEKRYEFTHEKAVLAGVIQPQQSKEKKSNKFSKPQREELVPDTEPPKRNPYMLKPARNQSAKSTTFVPKD
ncbi:hypothetical protein BASA81_001985 [Batrachochytrium salamandrivorans]|nr:hypothetical protein BASA81_001985 [Batrachochytrium salamandrivorans]